MHAILGTINSRQQAHIRSNTHTPLRVGDSGSDKWSWNYMLTIHPDKMGKSKTMLTVPFQHK
jgi:hypothetical protein